MLAIAGGKGGSGKTTTTLGLAAALPGTPTAIDADWDLPNLHALANVAREPSALDRAGATDPTPLSAFGRWDLTDGPGASTPVRRDGTDAGCRIVPAPHAEPDRDPERLLRMAAADSDHPVLFDCPAGAGPDAAAPLRVASGTVLVTTLTPAALRDTIKTAAMARALDAEPVGVVLTRCRTEPPDVGGGGLFDCPVLGTVPPVPPVPGGPLSSRRVVGAYREIAAALTNTW